MTEENTTTSRVKVNKDGKSFNLKVTIFSIFEVCKSGIKAVKLKINSVELKQEFWRQFEKYMNLLPAEPSL